MSTLYDTVIPMDRSFPPGTLPFFISTGGHYITDETYRTDRRHHPFYLLLYTSGGEGMLSYEGKTFQLGKGSIFLIDCRRPQVYCSAGALWEFEWIHFTAERCPGWVDRLISTQGPVFICPDSGLIRGKLLQIHALFREHVSLADLRASCLLTEIITQLYTCRKTKEGASQDTLGVMEVIETQYGKKITLDEIARAVSRSKYYLSHEFKGDTGLSIHKYLTLFRISKGKTLLQNTNLSVAEIAEQTGFESVSNFIRTFSAYEAVTPHQYRRQWK